MPEKDAIGECAGWTFLLCFTGIDSPAQQVVAPYGVVATVEVIALTPALKDTSLSTGLIARVGIYRPAIGLRPSDYLDGVVLIVRDECAIAFQGFISGFDEF
jgi:hypothetical protein